MSKSPLKQMKPTYVEHGPDKENKTTILGKDPKGGASKAYANSSIFSGDWDGDKNISGGELAAEAGMALIGSGLAKNALKKIAGKTSIKRIGPKVSKFFNNYINPASGKKIDQQAKTLINERNATLAKGGVIQEGKLGFKTAPSMANARKQAQNNIDFNKPISEVNLKTNAKKSVVPSTRKGKGDVQNWKTTPADAKKQLKEQLEK